MQIGEQIKTLRSQKNFTQEVLAAEMGVTVGAVSKWETGATLPDVQMLCSLADYFGVTTDYLLGRAHKGSFAVCDDAVFIRETIRGIMEKEGYTCAGLAENGAQLREIWNKNTPAVLFLDIHLGKENGLELLKELKETGNGTRIILVTADNSEKTLQTAISYKADALVTKPFMPQHIITALTTPDSGLGTWQNSNPLTD